MNGGCRRAPAWSVSLQPRNDRRRSVIGDGLLAPFFPRSRSDSGRGLPPRPDGRTRAGGARQGSATALSWRGEAENPASSRTAGIAPEDVENEALAGRLVDRRFGRRAAPRPWTLLARCPPTFYRRTARQAVDGADRPPLWSGLSVARKGGLAGPARYSWHQRARGPPGRPAVGRASHKRARKLARNFSALPEDQPRPQAPGCRPRTRALARGRRGRPARGHAGGPARSATRPMLGRIAHQAGIEGMRACRGGSERVTR